MSGRRGRGRSRGRTEAAALLCLVGQVGCLGLDPFLFAPARAAAGDDLLAAATAVPPALRYEAQGVVAADGTPVDTWVMAHADDDGTDAAHHADTVIYCHGNARNIAFFVARAQALWLLGYRVVLFDYRGYGKTPGRPSEAGTYADARAVRAYVQQVLGQPTARTALYGYSLGAAVCSQLAIESPTPALLLEAPFASVRELIQDGASLALPPAWFADSTFDTRGKIGAFDGSLLVLHGTADSFIDMHYGVEVYNAAVHAASRRLLLVPGAGHESVPCVDPDDTRCVSGFGQAYLGAVGATLEAALDGPGAGSAAP